VAAQHYFTPQPEAAGKRRVVTATLRGREFRFLTAGGVFSRGRVDAGTRLLIEALQVSPTDRFLDLGCGYGVVGVVAAHLAPKGRVVLVDVNPRAVALARDNLELNGVRTAEARAGDGFAAAGEDLFDVIAFNPPIRAGRGVVHRLIVEASKHLSSSGRFYLVARTRQGALRLAAKMRESFGNVEEAAKGGGYRVFISRRRASSPSA
jgi:16S rRNA (guanine1207-N2)-methyltransferase